MMLSMFPYGFVDLDIIFYKVPLQISCPFFFFFKDLFTCERERQTDRQRDKEREGKETESYGSLHPDKEQM